MFQSAVDKSSYPSRSADGGFPRLLVSTPGAFHLGGVRAEESSHSVRRSPEEAISCTNVSTTERNVREFCWCCFSGCAGSAVGFFRTMLSVPFLITIGSKNQTYRRLLPTPRSAVRTSSIFLRRQNTQNGGFPRLRKPPLSGWQQRALPRPSLGCRRLLRSERNFWMSGVGRTSPCALPAPRKLSRDLFMCHNISG